MVDVLLGGGAKIVSIGGVSSNRDNFGGWENFNGCSIVRNGKVREIRLEIDGGLFVV